MSIHFVAAGAITAAGADTAMFLDHVEFKTNTAASAAGAAGAIHVSGGATVRGTHTVFERATAPCFCSLAGQSLQPAVQQNSLDVKTEEIFVKLLVYTLFSDDPRTKNIFDNPATHLSVDVVKIAIQLTQLSGCYRYE